MKLKIFDKFQIKSFEINWLEVNTKVGNFVFKKNHSPTFLSLLENKEFLFELKNGKINKLNSFKNSFIHVKREEIKIFI